MIIQGVSTLDALPQFDNAVPGRTLILDGDGPCYVAAATVKRLDTAITRFKSEVLRCIFMSKATDCVVHLTSSKSDKHGRFRVIAEKPYQGNRSGKDKPALLEPLREAMANNANWLDDFRVVMHRELEADDGMMQDAYRYGEHGVIWSEDKDLRMTPYPYYDISTGQVRASEEHGWVSLKFTPSGVSKLVGQGPVFFWAQMLMGDTADNVRGLRMANGKLCGPAAAYGILKDVKSQVEAANAVIDLYRDIDQNVVAEGWLLWLTRCAGDNVIKYMQSLPLTKVNMQYVQDCVHRTWVAPREEKDE